MSARKTTPRRKARVLRILAVAIFFASSLQFIVHDPTSHGHDATVRNFYSVRRNETLEEIRSEGRAVPNTRTNIRRGLTADQSRQLASVHQNDTIVTELSKIKSGDYVAGEFCPYCIYNEDSLCLDRVHYLMSRYKISEEEAKANDAVASQCAAPWRPHNTYSEEDEPRVILHVGPHKTGTTALQAFIYDMMYANETTLLNDNLRVPSYDELPGVFGKEGVGLNLPHCSLDNYKASGGGMLSPMCHRMRVAFPQFMYDAYNKSQNVLIVAEDFDRAEIDYKRLRHFLRPYKKVDIVVMYRRLQDWLPSFYNQIVDHYTLIYAKGEEEYPSFVEWVEGQYVDFVKVHAMEVASRFRDRDYVASVTFLNMHEVVEKSNLIEHFFCDHLRAASTCAAIKAGATTSKSNIGIDHDYQRLTIKAALAGKLQSDLSRPLNIDRLTRNVKLQVEENSLHDKLQRMCPNKKMLERILDAEIEQERTYFPEWFESQGGEEELRRSYSRAVQEKFCSFDTDKIFESGILNHIFDAVKEKCKNVNQGKIQC